MEAEIKIQLVMHIVYLASDPASIFFGPLPLVGVGRVLADVVAVQEGDGSGGGADDSDLRLFVLKKIKSVKF